MRSFTIFTILLTAVLSTFTNAAPITLPDADIASDKSDLNKLGLPAVGREIKISSSGETDVELPTPSVAVVFTTVFTQIQPLTDQLNYLTPDNATVAAISPVVAQIKTQLTGAVSQLQALVGQDSSVIIASVDGTVPLTVAALATLIADVLTLLFTALGAVLSMVTGDVHTEILTLLTDLCGVVTSILHIVATLVPGIVVSLLPLLSPVLSIISSLGLRGLLSLLGLTL
ncbi:uncharacterized protein EDB91DRAFT_1083344 [Suillus paluster]|uniref:uncharacterized protein n=1 Tax=Suillus paluster TaxID=48578 RepID=UPI001B872BB7|nr:uncharacterized protein EDB91DRAFT_1083344 [Suillus paluster]KAG1736682.1 hypothetical protein EDB91DRAFT_1083344 [Suillus paluster]